MEKSKEETMRAHVDGWQQSGQTMRAYAESIGLTKGCLEYWIRKFRDLDSPPPNIEGGFVELKPSGNSSDIANRGFHVPPWPQQKPQVELTLPSGLSQKIYG